MQSVVDSTAGPGGSLQRPFSAYRGTDQWIFVCYAHEDAPIVYPEIARLHAAGYRIWYDEGITPGSEWSAALAEHILGCSVFMYFITPRSVLREHCRRELNFATNHDRPVLAVHLEPTQVPPALELTLSHRQAVFKEEHGRLQYEGLLDEALLGFRVRDASPASSSGVVADAPSRSPRQRTRAWTGALVLGTALAAWLASYVLTSRDESSAPISLAVLPFANPSGEESQGFLADGFTQVIVSELSNTPNLRIVARTSAFRFEHDAPSVTMLGNQLGATHLLQGSIRRRGTNVEVTARLVDAKRDVQLWSEHYDRRVADLVEIQGEIVTSIQGVLRLPSAAPQAGARTPRVEIDIDSYQQYLHAKSLVRVRRIPQVIQAIDILDGIVARSPDYAPAWALLALAHIFAPQTPAWFSGSYAEARRVIDDSLPKAEAAARRAVELDASLAEGHLALARIYAERMNLLLAEDAFVTALALDPTNPDVLHLYSNLLAAAGSVEDALEMKKQLLALEPYVPVYNANAAAILWLNGHDEEAITLLEDSPFGSSVGVVLAMIHAAAGRLDAAAAALGKVPPGDFLPGRLESAENLLRSQTAPDSLQAMPTLGVLSFVYQSIGKPDRAFDFYDFMLETGYTSTITVAWLWHSSRAPLRHTPRFKTFVRKAGLVEYWRARGWPKFCQPIDEQDFVCD